MRVAMLPAALAGVFASAAAMGETDCQLNGEVGPGKTCICDKGWTGSTCGDLDLNPDPVVAYGYGNPAADNYSSWGGGPPVFDGQQWHLFVSEIAAHCGMQTWDRLSQATHAVSSSAVGPFKRVGVVVGTETHNTYYAYSKPDGVHLLYTIFEGKSPESCNPYLKGCVGGASPGGTHGAPPVRPRSWQPGNTCPTGPGGAHIHWAKSLDGPWYDGGPLKMDLGDCSGCDNHNPAPWIFDNGTVLMIGRSKDVKRVPGQKTVFGHNLWLYRANSWNDTYKWIPGQGVNGTMNIGDGTSQDVTEDPTLWKGRRGFHALMHTGPDLTHAWSVDGFTWSYSANITGPPPGEGGSNERPRVLLDNNGDLEAVFVGSTPVQGSDASRTAAFKVNSRS